jgi:hypothetical protein
MNVGQASYCLLSCNLLRYLASTLLMRAPHGLAGRIVCEQTLVLQVLSAAVAVVFRCFEIRCLLYVG